MNKRLANAITNKRVNLVPVPKETAQKIEDISRETGYSVVALTEAAIEILQQSLGREVIMRSEDSDIVIQDFKKFKKHFRVNNK